MVNHMRHNNLITIASLSFIFVLLSACSEPTNQTENGNSNGSQNGNTFLQPDISSRQAIDTSTVNFSDLTPLDVERMLTEGLSTVMFNTELDCEDGFNETYFSFTDQSVQASLCDGTNFEANYLVDNGVLIMYAIRLDGRLTAQQGYDFWGQLNSQEQTAPLFCIYSHAMDSEVVLAGADAFSATDLIPPLNSMTFDCSEEAYLFYGEETAKTFITNRS